MHKRYLLLTIVVVGLAVAAGANPQNPIKSAETVKGTIAAPQTAPNLATSPSLEGDLNRIGAALEAANNREPSREESERAKLDLNAQLRMAKSADRMFWVGLSETAITFLGVMLVLATLIYTKKAAEAARDAVTEAKTATTSTREIGEAQVRAYLHISSVTASFYGGLEKPTFQATVINTGQSPARSTVCGVQVRYNAPGLIMQSELPNDWRSIVGKAVPIAGEGVVIPFESEKISLAQEIIADSEKENFGVVMSVRIVVAYRDVFNKSWDGDAYFVGFVQKNKEAPLGLFQSKWAAELKPVTRAQSWGAQS